MDEQIVVKAKIFDLIEEQERVMARFNQLDKAKQQLYAQLAELRKVKPEEPKAD